MAEDGLMEQLTGFLTSEDGMRQLQNAARMLGIGDRQEHNQSPPAFSHGTGQNDPFGGADPQLMMKMVRLMQNVRQETPSSAFLRALKPLLREERQNRVDDAIRMLQLFSVLPLLREMG